MCPPTSSAKSGALSGRGWHSHVTRASGVKSATVLPSESIAWRSIGTALAPASHSRRVSSSRASSRATSSGPSHAQLGEGGARADLDAEIGPGQAAERILVGDVVAHEDRRRGPDLVAQRIEREALVGLDDGELDHALALARVDAGEQRGALAHCGQGRGAILLRGLAVVQCGAGGLELDGDAGPGLGDGVELIGQLVSQRDRGGLERTREADVELGAVAADEVDLLGQARERGEIVQAASRDHRHAGVGERCQRAQRRDRLAPRAGLLRDVDDRRQRAVVVARDE